MRADMNHVIIDRPRIGYRTKHSKGNNKFGPFRSMRKLWKLKHFGSLKCKQFNEHLNPLHQFLVKNRGRLWNDVWSEICQFNDYRNIRGYHLRKHVLDMMLECDEVQNGKTKL